MRNTLASDSLEATLWQLIAEIHDTSRAERPQIVSQFAIRLEQVRIDRFLTEKQVVELWPNIFSCRWLQEARRKGIGPAYGVLHRKILYRRSDIETYISSHLVSRQPTTD